MLAGWLAAVSALARKLFGVPRVFSAVAVGGGRICRKHGFV